MYMRSVYIYFVLHMKAKIIGLIPDNYLRVVHRNLKLGRLDGPCKNAILA